MKRTKINKISQSLKKTPRARTIVFRELIQAIEEEKDYPEIRKMFNSLNKIGGTYCLVKYIIQNFDYITSLYEQKNRSLNYLRLLLFDIQVYIKSEDRYQAIQKFVDMFQKYVYSKDKKYITYMNTILDPIIGRTKSPGLNIEPSFYIEIIKDVLNTNLADDNLDIRNIRQWFLSVLLDDLEQIAYFDVPVADLAKANESTRDLFVAMRRNKSFMPKLLGYLHSLKQNNFARFMDMYPLAIEHSFLDCEPIDYSGLLEMLPDFVVKCHAPEAFGHSLKYFLIQVNNNQFDLIKSLIENKLDKYPNPHLVYYLSTASAYNTAEHCKTIINKVVSCPVLQPYTNSIIAGILESFRLSSNNETRRALGIATELKKHKDIFLKTILNNTYNITIQELSKFVVLLLLVAILDTEETWATFVKEKVKIPDVRMFINNYGYIGELLRHLIFYYLGSNKDTALAIQETVRRIDAAMNALLRIGFPTRLVDNSLKLAMRDLRHNYYIHQVPYSVSLGLVNRLNAKLRQLLIKK